MGNIPPPSPKTCLTCKHYRGTITINEVEEKDYYLEGELHHTCAAFKIIPEEISEGKNLHRKPLPEQENDIVYEPIKPE